jgi:hypothetical protein
MKTIIKLFVIIFFATFFSNCATIMSGSKGSKGGMCPLTVSTQPTGAKVVVTDKSNNEVFRGVSPVNMKLKAGDGFFSGQTYYVKISIDGYPEKVVIVKGKLSGWYIAGNLIWAPIGWIIDPLSGAIFILNKKVINEVFTKSTSLAEPSLMIIDIKDVPVYLKDQLVRIDQ